MSRANNNKRGHDGHGGGPPADLEELRAQIVARVRDADVSFEIKDAEPGFP